MKPIYLVFCILALCSTACHTMNFKSHPDAAVSGKDFLGADFDSWHHIGILSLVEFSDPIDNETKDCASWESVTVQNTFLTGLVGGITYQLYSPWTAKMICR